MFAQESYGGVLYQTCLQALKYDGDAMQKYDDLRRKQIQNSLATKLGKPPTPEPIRPRLCQGK